ncbi:hypothetical protein PSEUDO8BK_30819 [Pseudomonas sp. 8BK]|nr:hypothetical protein PSEUDO8BK_30819 [Pseudomonas sp. 8BK]
MSVTGVDTRDSSFSVCFATIGCRSRAVPRKAVVTCTSRRTCGPGPVCNAIRAANLLGEPSESQAWALTYSGNGSL